MNALVDATPISGPALIPIILSTFLAIVLLSTLTIPKVGYPLSCAASIAAYVSAVSPD